MGKAIIRKIVTTIEEIHREINREITPPTRRAASVAVIQNPLAGDYHADLTELIFIGAELGALLGERCIKALGIENCEAESYGKAAMVGEKGELEHAAAVLHPDLGGSLRKAIGGGTALIPSSKKMGAMGHILDIPLGHKNAAYVRSHFDGMEVRVSDAPRTDELIVAIALTNSGRPLARIGGLSVQEIKGEDGLR